MLLIISNKHDKLAVFFSSFAFIRLGIFQKLIIVDVPKVLSILGTLVSIFLLWRVGGFFVSLTALSFSFLEATAETEKALNLA